MPREMPQPQGEKPKDIVNIVYTIALAHTLAITPLIRSRQGSKALDLAPGSALLMLAYAGFANCLEIAYCVPTWAVVVFMRRCLAAATAHSRYPGWPWVLGWATTEYVARLGEVFLCFLAAAFLGTISPASGDFVLSEIVSLLIVFGIEQLAIRKPKDAMKDARIEAHAMGEMMKRGGR